MRSLGKWFCNLLLGPKYKLIRFKSWRPSWGSYGIEWPCMLVDDRYGKRSSVVPVWDRWHFRAMYYHLLNKEIPDVNA